MQQFYYLAVLFVAGGIGSASSSLPTCAPAGNRCALWKAYGYSPPSGPVFFGLWAYFAFGRAARHMPAQNDGTGKQKGSAKISELGKDGGIGETGNERQVGSAGQKEANGKPGTDGRKRHVRSGNGFMEGFGAGTGHEHAGTGDARDADGERNHDRSGRGGRYAGMKGTALKAGMADEAGIPDMASGASMPGMADRTDMPRDDKQDEDVRDGRAPGYGRHGRDGGICRG